MSIGLFLLCQLLRLFKRRWISLPRIQQIVREIHGKTVNLEDGQVEEVPENYHWKVSTEGWHRALLSIPDVVEEFGHLTTQSNATWSDAKDEIAVVTEFE